jgi:hypothetical protein
MDMPNRIAKFRSALLASLLAGTALTVASNTPVRAADNCLRAPRDETPPGSHWYYRIDHATQRQCWYLGEEKDRRARAAPQDSLPTADSDPPPKAKPAPRSVADARAELQWPVPRIEQQTAIAGSQPAVANIPNTAESGNNQQAATADADRRASLVASRWPEASDATASVNPVPAPPANPVPVTVASTAAPSNPTAAAPSTATVPPPPATPVVPLAAADVPSAKPTESIPMLLTIAVGALSVAGVMVSAIFRIGSNRRRRRRQIWDNRRTPPPWDSADAKRPSPPAYRHPRELPDPRERPDRANARPRPRPVAGPNDRAADFYAEISRRARS